MQLTRDDIADAVNTLQAPVRRRAFLKPDEIRQLLRARERHDAAMYAETREEHRGKRLRGTTPEHKRITPLVRCLLLTGLRIGEALQIRWRDVQGDELHVSADISKTREDRVVGLSVAPTAMPKRPKHAPDTAFVFQLSRGEVRAACRRTPWPRAATVVDTDGLQHRTVCASHASNDKSKTLPHDRHAHA